MKFLALKKAFPYTLPILFGFLFLGISYGFLMVNKGFSFVYPMLMSLFICAGSMEFLAITLLLSAFNPGYAFVLTLMVNARHLFYGIAMLEKYKNQGVKKFYLIYAMCDESFSINCSTNLPQEVDEGWFMFWVTVLNHFYWVMGATLGGLLGYVIHFNVKGIEFVMTALFLVMFLDQWQQNKTHLPAIVGLICSLLSLILFGGQQFIIPAMLLIVLSFAILKPRFDQDKKKGENKTWT